MNASTLLVALMTIAVAAPASAGDSAPCSEATDADALALGGHYVRGDLSVWQETNGIPGLQTETCADENGRDRPADTRAL